MAILFEGSPAKQARPQSPAAWLERRGWPGTGSNSLHEDERAPFGALARVSDTVTSRLDPGRQTRWARLLLPLLQDRVKLDLGRHFLTGQQLYYYIVISRTKKHGLGEYEPPP